MLDNCKALLGALLVCCFVALIGSAADPKPQEIAIAEFELTLVPPADFARNKPKEEETRKLLPASITAKTLTAIIEVDPAAVKREPARLPTYFTITGTRIDTTGMTPARQLRLANLGSDYFDTQEADLKIAGIAAKRFQYRLKPLVGEPRKDQLLGGVKYVFCRPGLMLQVSSDCVAKSEEAFAQFQKDCDAIVSTFKFSDK